MVTIVIGETTEANTETIAVSNTNAHVKDTAMGMTREIVTKVSFPNGRHYMHKHIINSTL